MIRFIDRKAELLVLENDWKTKENAFIVIYGRRRIGKTRLVEEFLKNKEGIKYTAEDTNKKIQITEFKNIIADYLKDEFLAKQEILDWSSLFSYLTKVIDNKKRVYLWIDEFSYLIKNDASITSVLQKFIDSFLRNSQIFFIVSGSLFGLMREDVLSHSSPLYGRRTRDILLKPVPPQYLNKFLNMNFENTLKTILTINGIPEYLLVASEYKNYDVFINEEFLKKEGYFYREPFFLLSREFKEIKTYFSILNALAYGNSRPSEIANFVGLNAREIYPYLELLINYGFIKRETSLLGDKKRGVYYINDSFFDFWFNFVHKNREFIESGSYKRNKEELNKFLGKRFEIFIKDNFRLFFEFEKYGRWWHKDKEIDIIAINEEKKKILFSECKWQEKVNPESIVKELIDKTKFVDGVEGKKESFAIFAKSFSKKIKEFEGKKVDCLDLKDIESLLRHSFSHLHIL